MIFHDKAPRLSRGEALIHPGRNKNHLYIAFSESLTELAQDIGQLFLFKIGVTDNVPFRLRTLRNGYEKYPQSRGPCLGIKDWRFTETWRIPGQASSTEERLKTVIRDKGWPIFDGKLCPSFIPNNGNGETEVHRINFHQLPELENLAALTQTGRNNFADAEILASVAKQIRIELEKVFPAIPEDMPHEAEAQESRRPAGPYRDERPDSLWDEDEALDHYLDDDGEHRLIIEEMDQSQEEAARSDDEGWPYPDRN